MDDYLLRIGMAVDNDDVFVLRMKSACAIFDVSYTRALGFQIAKSVVTDIRVTDGPVIDTSQVKDQAILDALTKAIPGAETYIIEPEANEGVTDG